MTLSTEHHDSARNSPSPRDIAAFVDARRAAGGLRRGAHAMRLRLPRIEPKVRKPLIFALAWVGIAQWIGWVLRLLRDTTGAV